MRLKRPILTEVSRSSAEKRSTVPVKCIRTAMKLKLEIAEVHLCLNLYRRKDET